MPRRSFPLDDPAEMCAASAEDDVLRSVDTAVVAALVRSAPFDNALPLLGCPCRDIGSKPAGCQVPPGDVGIGRMRLAVSIGPGTDGARVELERGQGPRLPASR